MPDGGDLDRGRLTAPGSARLLGAAPEAAPSLFPLPSMTDAAAVAARAEPRVRMAPSPTGYFHVGSARAALFNWFYARQHGGTLVLRIEDTDEERSRTEWTEGIISAMTWLGMAPDAGPYLQSAEGEAHQAAIEALWSSGALLRVCVHTGRDRRPGQGTGGGGQPDTRLRRFLP